MSDWSALHLLTLAVPNVAVALLGLGWVLLMARQREQARLPRPDSPEA